ncbi:hypothetical protein TWF281_006230 [Arthrobotrys megalospora]
MPRTKSTASKSTASKSTAGKSTASKSTTDKPKAKIEKKKTPKPSQKRPKKSSKSNDADTERGSPLSNEAPSLTLVKSSKRKRAGTDIECPTSKKPRVGTKLTQSSAAADPAKDATADPPSHRSASQLEAATSPICAEKTGQKAATPCAPSTATPNFEWINVTHTREAFLVRLQLRHFFLLFGDLAPRSIRPENVACIRSKLLSNPTLVWTPQEMRRIMHVLLSIIGNEGLKRLIEANWPKGISILKRPGVVYSIKRKMARGDLRDNFYYHLYGNLASEDGQSGGRYPTDTLSREDDKREIPTSRNRDNNGVQNRNRTAASTVAPAAEYYKLLQQLMIIGCSGNKPRKQLQANESSAKKLANDTKKKIRALNLELKAIDKGLTKKGIRERERDELKDAQTTAQAKLSSLSLTEWLEMQKLDPRASQRIGEDPLGNIYYILPHSEELEGYASWVLCQKGPGLDHPLGEDWVRTEDDGGTEQTFYAIDGTQAIEVLVEWLKKKIYAEKKRIGSGDVGQDIHPRSTSYDVLIEKLQQFAQMLQLNGAKSSAE